MNSKVGACIGFIGLGAMGQPMLAVGNRLVITMLPNADIVRQVVLETGDGH